MTLVKYLRYFHYFLVVVISSLIGLNIVLSGSMLEVFLISSLLLVVYSLVNLLYTRYSTEERIISWQVYAGFMFAAMVFGSIGDFAMPGILLFPTEIALLNGVLYFGIGHVIYLFGLRKASPLILDKTEERRAIKPMNLLCWIISLIVVVILFQLTVFDPNNLALSIGVLGYGILLVTVLAFAITKWFDDFPFLFKLALTLGFLLFFISDWVIGIRNLRDSTFMSGTAFVGATYAIGQFLIQTSTLLGFSSSDSVEWDS